MTRFLPTVALLLVAAAQPALAETVTLKGKAAEAFINKTFPDAYVPGPVEGKFTDVSNGQKRVGHAKCDWPAMGAAGDGVVTTCTITY